jgi:hypothetical protein
MMVLAGIGKTPFYEECFFAGLDGSVRRLVEKAKGVTI